MNFKGKGQLISHSFLESASNILIGFIVALASQLVVFPLFHINIPLADNLGIGGIFTIISLVRSFFLRRVFNRVMITSWSKKR